jgi:phosphoglucosamine mutase
MVKLGVNLGGEQSGHMIFSDFSTTGDGLLTALKVLEIMCRTEKPLSELASVFERFPQKLININVRRKPELSSVDAIKDIIEKKEKELEDKGRILVRYSGTENKARVMVECEDEDACKKHATDVAEIIEAEIGAV